MVKNEGMIASARLKLASFHAIMLVIADGRVARSCILILLAVTHCDIACIQIAGTMLVRRLLPMTRRLRH